MKEMKKEREDARQKSGVGRNKERKGRGEEDSKEEGEGREKGKR